MGIVIISLTASLGAVAYALWKRSASGRRALPPVTVNRRALPLAAFDDEPGLSSLGPGDVVSYRCQDCRDRWDLVLPDAPDDRAD